jgi:hypothetical protein
MEIVTKGNGRVDRPMEKELSFIPTEGNMRETGYLVFKREKEIEFIQMAWNIKVNGREAKGIFNN